MVSNLSFSPGPVNQATGIEEFAGRQAAAGNPLPQFFDHRFFLFDMARGVGDAMVVQPSFGLLAGGARRILQKQHNGHFPFRLGGLRLIYYNPPPCVCQCKRKCSLPFLRMYVCKRSVGLQFGLRVLRLLQIIYGGIKHGR